MGRDDDGGDQSHTLEESTRPKEIERLELAYKHALRSLSLVDRNDPLTDMIAKKVIEIGAPGVRDPAKIEQSSTPRDPGEVSGRPHNGVRFRVAIANNLQLNGFGTVIAEGTGKHGHSCI